MRNYFPVIRAGCSAFAAFIAFLLLIACLETIWPGFEHSKRFGWVFGTAYVVLLIAELYYYYHLRMAMARVRFFRHYAGATFLLATTRKGWYPLFNAMATSSTPRDINFVWWREISSSDLGIIAPHRPPVDLPFAVKVRSNRLEYTALGSLLRQFSKGRMRIQGDAAFEAVETFLRGAA